MKQRGRATFVCSVCGLEEPRWLGRCPGCGEWNSLTETAPGKGPPMGRKPAEAKGGGPSPAKARALEAVDPAGGERFGSTIGELDRVLGGGMVRGSSILVGGEPGIGKSTLLLQAAAGVSVARRVVYVSGEESAAQIRSRAERLGLVWGDFYVLAASELEAVEATVAELRPELLVIDSIQTLKTPEAGSVPGTINQLRFCAYAMAEWARTQPGTVVFIAHVTKEGAIAGPKLIEHLVDTVLHFEQSSGDVRFLRAAKNRFGSVDEIGLFTMGGGGLAELSDTASYFLVERSGELPAGVVAAPVYEGSRVLLVEVQALTVPAKGGFSRVFSDRIDSGRVSRVAAVLERHVGVRFSDQDLYVNVAGGIRLAEVGTELPLAVALYSARTAFPLPRDLTVTGELSLAGEVRPVPHLRRRIRAAADLGYTTCVGPSRLWENEDASETWRRVASINECIQVIFGGNGGSDT